MSPTVTMGHSAQLIKEDGKRVDLTLWSPSADKVSVVVYDKKDPEKVVGTVALEKEKRNLETNSGCKLWSRYQQLHWLLLPLPDRGAKVKLSSFVEPLCQIISGLGTVT